MFQAHILNCGCVVALGANTADATWDGRVSWQGSRFETLHKVFLGFSGGASTWVWDKQ